MALGYSRSGRTEKQAIWKTQLIPALGKEFVFLSSKYQQAQPCLASPLWWIEQVQGDLALDLGSRFSTKDSEWKCLWTEVLKLPTHLWPLFDPLYVSPPILLTVRRCCQWVISMLKLPDGQMVNSCGPCIPTGIPIKTFLSSDSLVSPQVEVKREHQVVMLSRPNSIQTFRS